MSDAALDAKFRGLAEGILPAEDTERLIRMCRGVSSLTDAADMARAAVPSAVGAVPDR